MVGLVEENSFGVAKGDVEEPGERWSRDGSSDEV